jgi:hypothetical protein
VEVGSKTKGENMGNWIDWTRTEGVQPGQGIRRNFADTGFESFDTISYTESDIVRDLNDVYQPSSSANMFVTYAVDIAATLTLSGGQTGIVIFEISPDGSTEWKEIDRATNGNTGTLVIGISITHLITGNLVGTVPAGWYARLRTSGTATYTYRAGQESILGPGIV